MYRGRTYKTGAAAAFEKLAAGPKDALKYLLTGRVPLYHVTPNANVSSIMTKGVRPQASAGLSGRLSDAEKGLSFFARSNREAHGLGAELHDKGLNPQVLKASVPQSLVGQTERSAVAKYVEGRKAADPSYDASRVDPASFVQHVALEGGVPPAFIEGSPSYKGVSASEVGSHLMQAARSPIETAKNALRVFTGWSHRPETLMNQIPDTYKQGSESALSHFGLNHGTPKPPATWSQQWQSAKRPSGTKQVTIPSMSETKIAGVRDALRVALTGRVPLRHGTSAGRAAAIRQMGLLPQGANGVSHALDIAGPEKGLAFLTRDRAAAKSYALQQVGMDRADALHPHLKKLVGHFDPELAEDVVGDPGIWNKSKVQIGRLLGSLPGGGKSVVEARIPRSVLNTAEGTVPEFAGNASLQALRELAPKAGRAAPVVQTMAASPFMSVVTQKGGVPPQYIKGSPEYQGVGLDELKNHFMSIRQDPRGFGKDVLRALTGVQHRPSTLIQQNPLPNKPGV